MYCFRSPIRPNNFTSLIKVFFYKNTGIWFPTVKTRIFLTYSKTLFLLLDVCLNPNPTKDKLHQRGMAVDRLCILLIMEYLYEQKISTSSFGNKLWTAILIWLPTTSTYQCTNQELLLVWSAGIYEIWR